MRFIERELECLPGIKAPSQLEPFKIGCSVEVRVDYVDKDGARVEEDVTGGNVEWQIAEGESLLTLPDDENPWRRWMTAQKPGRYRIVSTLHMRKTHEKIVGEIAGHIAP